MKNRYGSALRDIDRIMGLMGNEGARKRAIAEEQAIIELISLTGFNLNAFNLKGITGAQHAIEAIRESGYNISAIETEGSLETVFILQQYGETIAQRNVSLKINVNKNVKEI